MIDLHCHILPGIDDGPETTQEAVALAQACQKEGIQRVVATPHVSLRYPNNADDIHEALSKLRTELDQAGVGLRVDAGAEVSASVAIDMSDEEIAGLTLGNSSWILLEPPSRSTHFALQSSIGAVRSRGWNVLLAHPERNPMLQENPELLASLVDGGVKTQITAGSLTGRYGRSALAAAREMMNRGLVHTIASDAHHATLRPPEMAAPLIKVRYAAWVAWLCQEMPAWILDGGELPRRPEQQPRKGKGLLRKFRRRG